MTATEVNAIAGRLLDALHKTPPRSVYAARRGIVAAAMIDGSRWAFRRVGESVVLEEWYPEHGGRSEQFRVLGPMRKLAIEFLDGLS